MYNTAKRVARVKKRMFSILLMCCMVLTLLPATAFAGEDIQVNTGRLNEGEIEGGIFDDKVINNSKITGGKFYGEVVNNGEITGGSFYGEVVNNGKITGGVFYGTVTGSGTISESLYKTVTFDSDGSGAVASQRVLQGQKAQRPEAITKEGHTFVCWFDTSEAQNSNVREWYFNVPVTKDLELKARWLQAMTISNEPVTYLDADGREQVCTEYTVLENNTAEDILALENKWYDLPAGWYVVEGSVTITPRVDTHGAVNFILKDNSQFTAEWGINVKEDDTFTVYAQSTDEKTMGKLTACLPEEFKSGASVDYEVWPERGLSGIGSGVRWRKANDGIHESEGTIIINGGNILARGQYLASAIGGTGADTINGWSDSFGNRQCGSVTINDGFIRTEVVTKVSLDIADSVGIGSCQSGYGGSVTINGGTVIA